MRAAWLVLEGVIRNHTDRDNIVVIVGIRTHRARVDQTTARPLKASRTKHLHFALLIHLELGENGLKCTLMSQTNEILRLR